MGWFNVLKTSDENLTQAVESVFSDTEDKDEAEEILIRLYGETKIRPFIIAYNVKQRESKGYGKVTEGDASKRYGKGYASRWKK